MGLLYLYTSAEIAERIKAASKAKGVQVKDVLEQSGMTKNALGTMRAGSFPKSDNLAKIAAALDCSVDYLLGLTNDPTPAGAKRPAMTSSEEQIMKSLEAARGRDGQISPAMAEALRELIDNNLDFIKRVVDEK